MQRIKAFVFVSTLIAIQILFNAGSARGDEVQKAIDETMTEARRAVDELGTSDAAMKRIQVALNRLARTSGLKKRAHLSEVHGSETIGATVLASDGDDRITLFLVRFAPGTSTTVHDHTTWGVIHLLEGRHQYIQWERIDKGSDPEHAELRVKYEKVLDPGDSVYWHGPPHDIHSQETKSGPVWVLGLAGKNLMSEAVTRHRHYFDPETGRITSEPPQ